MDFEKNIPLKYTTKVFVLPHLNCFVFGIGIYEFTKAFYVQLFNVVTDNFDYFKNASQKICLNLYQELQLNRNKIYTKVFLACRELERSFLISFSSDNNFKPEILEDAIGLFPNNKEVMEKLLNETNKEKIDINNVVNVILDNEKKLDCGGEYIFHMFSDTQTFLINRIAKSPNYKSLLNEMIKNCSSLYLLRGLNIYFDQNVWSNIVDDISLKKYDCLKKLLNNIKADKINITYSSVNIKETCKRKYESKRFEELYIIKKITNNLFIDEKYERRLIDPFDIYEQQMGIDPIVNSLVTAFQNEVNKLTNYDSYPAVKAVLLDKKVANNIAPDAIFEFLNKHMKKGMNSLPLNMNTNIYENAGTFLTNITNLLCNFIESALPDLPELPKSDCIKIIRAAMEKQGEAILSKKMTLNDIKNTNIDTIFENLGYKEEMIPGLLNGFLEASNYHPDKNKLKEKKNVIIDGDDMSHANYCVHFDIFVSEDKKLKERLLAVKDKLKFKTEILSLNELLVRLNG